MSAAGLCEAAASALKRKPKGMQGKLLGMLGLLLRQLCKADQKEALAPLLAGNVVELTVEEVVKNGLGMHEGCLLDILHLAAEYPQGQRRLSAPAVVKQLIKAAAGWLLQVHHMLASRKGLYTSWGCWGRERGCG